MRKLLVTLVVLAVILVGGDRIAHQLVTGEAEKRLSNEGLSDPSVKVGGFPFVTQLISRRFHDVTVSTPTLTRHGVRAQSVSATATDVDVPSGGDVTVATITARGTISYAEVLAQVGQDGLRLSRASSDEVRLRRSVTVLGQTVGVSARGRIEPSGRSITVVPRGFELEGGGAVSPALAASLTDQFSLSYAVRGLPRGMRIDTITPAADGFVVTLSGRDVRLSSAGT
jgi:LmeA-like phospholipid-binding